jgi:hypothetical protein
MFVDAAEYSPFHDFGSRFLFIHNRGFTSHPKGISLLWYISHAFIIPHR